MESVAKEGSKLQDDKRRSGVNQESQNYVASLQNNDSSKETFEESDVDSGHNSIDHSSVFNDGRKVRPYINDFSGENIWVDPSINTSAYDQSINQPINPNLLYDNVIETDESVIYHDPVAKTKEEDKEVSGVKDSSDVFVTVARKSSVLIVVDKWTAETIPVKEIPGGMQENDNGSQESAIYGVVKKDRSTKIMVDNVNDKPDDVVYGVVNKQAKTKQRNSQTDLIDEACSGLVNETNKKTLQDIGQAGAINCKGEISDCDPCIENRVGVNDDVYQELPDENQSTLYANVDGKVMIVSDEGDYASVNSLSDSDTSNKEIRNSIIVLDAPITKTDCRRSEVQPRSKADSGKPQNRYAMQYLGSVHVNEEDLSPQKSTAVIVQCIHQVSAQSSQKPAASVVYEWPKDTKMVMEISDSRNTLKLLDCHSLVSYTDHFLHAIRIWAVGKEPNSKHFAYIIRNGSQKYVCRVFLCDVTARHVAATIRNICHRLANRDLKKVDESKRKSTASLAESSPKGISKNVARKEITGASSKGTGNKESVPVSCNYIGVLQVDNPTGKETVESAMHTVFEKMSQEKWSAVHLKLSPTCIEVKEISNSGGKFMSLPVETVTYIGSSTKNKKLAAIVIRSKDNVIHAHVFHCEPNTKELEQRIESVCEINPSAFGHKHKNSKDDIPKQKGLKGGLLGKLMPK